MTIYFWTPDVSHAAGGVRAVYRFVDHLNGAGIDAAVMHQRRGFRAAWFEHRTAVVAAQDTRVGGKDILVVSELDAAELLPRAPGVTKIVLNQHQYWTFAAGRVDYRHPDVASVIAVSEDGVRYLKHAFPGLAPHRVRYAVDTRLFHPRVTDRTRSVRYLGTKGAGPRSQVLTMLGARGALKGWDVQPLAGLTQERTADVLGSTAVLATFSEAEGFQMFLTEAMASGCAVVGFDAGGGREYLTEDVSWPVPAADVVAFAERLEEVTSAWDRNRLEVSAKTEAAIALVRQRYTLADEAADIVAAVRPALALAARKNGARSFQVASIAPRTAGARRRLRAVVKASVRG